MTTTSSKHAWHRLWSLPSLLQAIALYQWYADLLMVLAKWQSPNSGKHVWGTNEKRTRSGVIERQLSEAITGGADKSDRSIKQRCWRHGECKKWGQEGARLVPSSWVCRGRGSSGRMGANCKCICYPTLSLDHAHVYSRNPRYMLEILKKLSITTETR